MVLGSATRHANRRTLYASQISRQLFSVRRCSSLRG